MKTASLLKSLSILSDFDSDVAWMTLISSLLSLFSKYLRTAPKALTTINIMITSLFYGFQLSSKIKVFFYHFAFFHFHSVERLNPRDNKFFSSGLLVFISKFQKILLCLIFCFVHIPFVIIGKFQFLAQFQMDHISHPIIPTLVFTICQFVAFAY